MNNNDSGKEFMEKLEWLMQYHASTSRMMCTEHPVPELVERRKLIIRDLVDYLNLSDHRKGLMVKGPHE